MFFMRVFTHFPTKGMQKYTFGTQLQMFAYKNLRAGGLGSKHA